MEDENKTTEEQEKKKNERSLYRIATGLKAVFTPIGSGQTPPPVYRTNMIDYGMAKAALNMATMNLVNTFKEERKVNLFCIHPGWIRTNGREDNPAPLSSYEAAGILQRLFDEKWKDFEGPRFITNDGEAYPF